MTGRDLSTERPVRVRLGSDRRLSGFRARAATLIPYGRRWSSSDAEMVSCSVSRTAVICRHWRDHGFKLGLRRGHRLF
jgi:hypothetical protein